MWATNGEITGPNPGDILADTGPLSVGSVSFTIITWSDDGPNLLVEHRNALNDTTLHSFRYLPGGVPLHVVTFPLVLLVNERVRVKVLSSQFGGTTQVSILTG